MFRLNPNVLEQTIKVPELSKPLSIAAQDGELCLYMVAPEGAPLEDRIVKLFLNDQPLPVLVNYDFLGTVVIDNFSTHVFVKL